MDCPTWDGVLIAGAAVIAASLAALTANLRMNRQLRHDRKMRELAELRSMLDAAVVAANEALQAIKRAKRYAELDDDRLADVVAEGPDLCGEVSHQGGRLYLRFGRNDEITSAYTKVHQALLALFDVTNGSAPWPQKTQEAVEEAELLAHQRLAAFADHCRPYVRVSDEA
jgi:hypothetical protein